MGDKLSRFDNLDALYVDSLIEARVKQQVAASGGGENQHINLDLTDVPQERMRSGRAGTIFKMPATRTVAVYERVGLNKFVYQEAPDFLTWTITPATATVAGYACQQATARFGGRAWEAWFTRAVPRPEGPYKFYGLPGLIVKVGDLRGHYVFTLTRLRTLPAPGPPIELPEGSYKAVSRAEFRQGQARYAREGFAQLLASGNIRFKSPEDEAAARRRMQEKAQRPDNPLELE